MCQAFFASIVVFGALGIAGSDVRAPPNGTYAPQFVWLNRMPKFW
jgi:hypothetical protein